MDLENESCVMEHKGIAWNIVKMKCEWHGWRFFGGQETGEERAESWTNLNQ